MVGELIHIVVPAATSGFNGPARPQRAEATFEHSYLAAAVLIERNDMVSYHSRRSHRPTWLRVDRSIRRCGANARPFGLQSHHLQLDRCRSPIGDNLSENENVLLGEARWKLYRGLRRIKAIRGTVV
jgi:hypothetical protein